MAASKKDFVAIAAIIRDHATVSGRTPQEKSWFDSVAIDIATHFDNTVPTFDRQRFLAACGVK